MRKKNLLDKIFPVSHDFYGMLESQTEATAKGVQAMADSALQGKVCQDCPIFAMADRADEIRMDMELKLVEAFTTPFDRQDIYSISIEMDRIIEAVKYSVLAMVSYKVEADTVIKSLSSCLAVGVQQLYQAVCLLRSNHREGEAMISAMRRTQTDVEDAYREGMAQLFETSDPMMAMRKREIYRHLRDAVVFFGFTVDRFHKIVVRQA